MYLQHVIRDPSYADLIRDREGGRLLGQMNSLKIQVEKVMACFHIVSFFGGEWSPLFRFAAANAAGIHLPPYSPRLNAVMGSQQTR